jgi:hypothetical protein
MFEKGDRDPVSDPAKMDDRDETARSAGAIQKWTESTERYFVREVALLEN